MTKEYEVGYGKPPKHTRFKKGVSGNPSGRPRKIMKADDTNILSDLLAKKTTVSENGKRVRIRLIEAYFRRLLMDAINGKPHAVKALQAIFEKNWKIQERFNPAKTQGETTQLTLMEMLRAIDGKSTGIPDFSKLKEEGDTKKINGDA